MTPPSLGRLASRIAVILMGKNKPIWDPSTDCGDYVVVTNCAALYTTGNKKWQKTYYRHNTKPGSLRSVTMDVLMAKFGGSEVLRRAGSGMLPKNRLRDKRLARLCGYGTYRGLIGHVDKTDPLRLLDRDDAEDGMLWDAS